MCNGRENTWLPQSPLQPNSHQVGMHSTSCHLDLCCYSLAARTSMRQDEVFQQRLLAYFLHTTHRTLGILAAPDRL